MLFILRFKVKSCLKPVKLHKDDGALNALCLHMSLFTNRLNKTGQN